MSSDSKGLSARGHEASTGPVSAVATGEGEVLPHSALRCRRLHHGGGLLSSLVVAGHDNGGQLHYAGRVEFGVPRRDTTLLNLLETIGEPTVTVVGASEGSSIR